MAQDLMTDGEMGISRISAHVRSRRNNKKRLILVNGCPYFIHLEQGHTRIWPVGVIWFMMTSRSGSLCLL
jgi:hypothetical protein